MSERANEQMSAVERVTKAQYEQMEEGVAQYLRRDNWLFWTIVDHPTLSRKQRDDETKQQNNSSDGETGTKRCPSAVAPKCQDDENECRYLKVK